MMFRLERTTGKRRLSWVSVVGVLLVPMIVAGGFLAATWNSSSRWGKVQAAIVNNDAGAKINGQTVPLGRQLAGGLVDAGSKNDNANRNNFDWVITDSDDAADGLADGQYAAVVTIPKNFSADATSYSKNTGDKAEQATLDIATSNVSGVTDSAIAQAISAAAVSSMNNQLTKSYLDNLYLGFNQTSAGMKKSADGADKLNDGASRLSDGIGKSAAGSQKLTNGLDQLGDGTKQLSTGLDQTDTGSTQLATGAEQLATGLKQTSGGVSKLDKGVGKLDTSMGDFSKGAKQTSTGVTKYTKGVGKYADGVKKYTDGVSGYADGVDQYVGGVNQLIKGMQKSSAATGQLTQYAAGTSSYVKGVDKAADGASQAVINQADPTASRNKQQIQAMCTKQGWDATTCGAYIAGMQQGLKTGAEGTAAGVKQGVGSNSEAGKRIISGSADLQKSLSGASTGGTGDLKQLKQAGTKLTKGGEKLASRGTKLGTSGTTISKSGDQLGTGVGKLAAGAKQLQTGVSGIHDATGKLADGTAKLSKGATQLSSGATKLSDGTGKLADAGDQLATGTKQSATGSAQLTKGLTQLHTGGTQLADGTKSLADGLAKAADQLPSYSKNDRTQLAKVASAPVAADQSDELFSNVVTTTLLMALALWIGGLATYLVVRAVPRDAFGSSKSSLRLALEGIAPGVVIGAAQAVVLSVMMGVLLDLSVGRTFGLLGFALLAAIAFAVVNHALVAWFGGIGRFVSLAVAVLATAGALTTALPDLFGVIRPYLPTTPALDGARAIITGSSAGDQIGVLIAWLVIGAVAGILAVVRRRVAPSIVPAVG
ncbi:YhgE/Pip domain-containing protein [Microlunatus elymi]|uniref:YhgE/Pip domain-containing protein n=1 Tax=Microlunatus elymi TaxID=2596828 RepID=A0A516PU02_9ACTN|nr:YhgE/Pip domain-containing protein [Microlunatus elymi]QDP94657.1 YhgE/Pip domain-containing protein [Microlunatus elymi]